MAQRQEKTLQLEQPATGFALSSKVVTPQNLSVGIAYAISPTTVVDKLGGNVDRVREYVTELTTLVMRIAAGERAEDIEQVQRAKAGDAPWSAFDSPQHLWWINGQLWLYALDIYLDRKGPYAVITDAEDDAYMAVYRYCGLALGISQDDLSGDGETVPTRLSQTSEGWLAGGELVDSRSPALFWQIMSDGPISEALGLPPLGTIMELLRRHMLYPEYEPFEKEYNRLCADPS